MEKFLIANAQKSLALLMTQTHLHLAKEEIEPAILPYFNNLMDMGMLDVYHPETCGTFVQGLHTHRNRGAWELQSQGVAKSQTDRATWHTHTHKPTNTHSHTPAQQALKVNEGHLDTLRG